MSDTARQADATTRRRTSEAQQLLHRATPAFVDENGEHAGYREPNRAERRRAAQLLRRRGKGWTR